MSRSLRTVAVAAALLVVATACGRSEAPVVLTASSLVDVTAALVDRWPEAEPVVSDAGSQVIAAQLRAGADADVVLLADPEVAAALHREGLADAPRPVARSGLAVVVARSAAGAVDDLGDLRRASLRLVLADDAVPLGRYTRAALDRAESRGLLPPGGAAEVVANADSLEDAARVVLAKVVVGEADAAVVYASDAVAAGDAVAHLPWPPSADVPATYTVQVVTGARPAAAALADHLAGAAVADVWRRHGFEPRAPDAAAAG